MTKLLNKLFRIILFGGMFAVFAYGCGEAYEQDCSTIAGLDPLLKPGQVILLGEIHGTQEGPGYVGRIACLATNKKLSVSIGLELPQSDQSVVNSYLNSAGLDVDKQKVLNLPFWARDYQDGRASQAMFGVLESIRRMKAHKEKVDIFLIDNPSSDDRDVAMAQRVIEEAEQNPSNFIIVLTGNYHNVIYEGSGQMGSYVLAKLGEDRVLSLIQSYTGGSAWVDVAGEGFGPIGLMGDGRKEVGVFLDKGMGEYHGTLEMDSIHHSRPAKEMIEK